MGTGRAACGRGGTRPSKAESEACFRILEGRVPPRPNEIGPEANPYSFSHTRKTEFVESDAARRM